MMAGLLRGGPGWRGHRRGAQYGRQEIRRRLSGPPAFQRSLFISRQECGRLLRKSLIMCLLRSDSGAGGWGKNDTGSRFHVSGSGSDVSGSRFNVSGSGGHVSDWAFHDGGSAGNGGECGFRVWGSCFRGRGCLGHDARCLWNEQGFHGPGSRPFPARGQAPAQA